MKRDRMPSIATLRALARRIYGERQHGVGEREYEDSYLDALPGFWEIGVFGLGPLVQHEDRATCRRMLEAALVAGLPKPPTKKRRVIR